MAAPRQMVTVRLRGRPGSFATSPAGGGQWSRSSVDQDQVEAGAALRAQRAQARAEKGEPTDAAEALLSNARPDAWRRQPDNLPNVQAFSPPVINAYPKRTAACRQCEELEPSSCARACCPKVGRTNADLVNAIAAANCPLGKFSDEL